MLDILKKVWIWIATTAFLVLGAIAGVVFWRSRSKDALNDSLNRLVDAKRQELDAHEAQVESERVEVRKAEAIQDEAARLKALADIANRRRG
jgi:uncharacterized membrane-anchored protein YhcB (DUF1043 family)